MRVKDSSKNNGAEGGKKESKKKSGRQKSESHGAVTAKAEKTSKTEKEGLKRSTPKDETENQIQVLQYVMIDVMTQ